MKKNYNVVNEIESPELINLNKKNVMKSVDTIVNNLLKYNVGYPLSGVKTNVTKKQDLSIGHNYFYPLGYCNHQSSPTCQNQIRHLYIRDIPTGILPFNNKSPQELLQCNLTSDVLTFRGIIPGLMEDISDLSPSKLHHAYLKNGDIGSYQCIEKTYPVGYYIYNKSQEGKTWNYETKCTSSFHNIKKIPTLDSNNKHSIPISKIEEHYTNYSLIHPNKWIIYLFISTIMVFTIFSINHYFFSFTKKIK